MCLCDSSEGLKVMLTSEGGEVGLEHPGKFDQHGILNPNHLQVPS